MGTRAPGKVDGLEWDAEAYHELARPQTGWGNRIVEALPLRGGERVLDAGCGSGRMTLGLAERLPRGRVVALDRSLNMIQAARAYVAPSQGDKVAYVQGDLQALPFAGAFDLIVSTATLHWVRDHPALFRSLWTALAPGGWLIAQFGGGPNIARLRDWAEGLMRAAPYAQYFAGWPGPWEFPGVDVTAARLRDAGFSGVSTSLVAAPERFGDPAQYAAFLRTIVFPAHLERLPDPLREPFVQGVVTRAAATDPPYVVDYWRLNLRARRPPRG